MYLKHAFFILLLQSSRVDILDLLLNAEEVDIGGSGLSDLITQQLAINMDSDTQELKSSSGQEENGLHKKKQKRGLTPEVH